MIISSVSTPDFDNFLLEYENRFEREYGYLRPVIMEVVEKYLDCGNPKCGFARIRCPDCGTDKSSPSPAFSCFCGRFRPGGAFPQYFPF